MRQLSEIYINTIPESSSSDFQSRIKLIMPFTLTREYLASFLPKSSSKSLKTLWRSFSHRLRVGRPPDFFREGVCGRSANFSHNPRNDSTSLQTSWKPGSIVVPRPLLFFDDVEDLRDFDWLVRFGVL